MPDVSNSHIEDLRKRAVKVKSATSIQEFYSGLDRHFTSPHLQQNTKVRDKSATRLKTLASQNTAFNQLYSAFEAYSLSGQHAEKPECPMLDCSIEVEIPVISHSGAFLVLAGTENTSEIWDGTASSEGSFVLRELVGLERLLGVFTSYQDVNVAAHFTASRTDAGSSDVLIENISLYTSADDFIRKESLNDKL